jgi:hypothetical protein
LLLPPNPVSGTDFELTKYSGSSVVSIDTNGKKFNGVVPTNLRYTTSSFISDTSDKIAYVNSTIGWISTRKQVKPAVILTYVSNGDINGLVYYLGTNGLATTFTNPATNGKLPVVASSTTGFTPTNLTDRVSNEWYSADGPGQWVAWDLGVSNNISISKYTIRNRTASPTALPRNWVLEGSNSVVGSSVTNFNSATWTTIDTRNNDVTLTAVQQYYTITANGSSSSFQYLRLRNTGVDSSNINYLCFNEIEFYGTLSFN